MTIFSAISSISNPISISKSSISSSGSNNSMMGSNSVACGGCGGSRSFSSGGLITLDLSVNVNVNKKSVYSRSFHDSYSGSCGCN